MHSINLSVASQLKKLRAEKGWSLDVTSQHCGVSKAMLGQIERGESSPTIAKLWQIATGFALPLSDFLGPIAQLDNSKQQLVEENISIKTLFEYDEQTHMEMFELQLSAGHEQHSKGHQSGVIEHIVVLAGQMQYFHQGQWHSLVEGERTKFCADQAHAYRNSGEQLLKFINIVYYPEVK